MTMTAKSLRLFFVSKIIPREGMLILALLTYGSSFPAKTRQVCNRSCRQNNGRYYKRNVQAAPTAAGLATA
eukprot:5299713-Amphidinium_carterae.1